MHQTSNSTAITFWAGCGAVRRDVFFSLGGYDELRFLQTSVEDIDLGYRLYLAGHTIQLDPEIQVRHLKDWRFETC